MTKREMKEAMDLGKTLLRDDGTEAWLDYESAYAPYVYRRVSGFEERLNNGWDYYNWEVKEEPKQITDRFKLMLQVQKRLRDGELFLVRYQDKIWVSPPYFGYDLTDYEWTAIDEETGQPIGEPHKFMED